MRALCTGPRHGEESCLIGWYSRRGVSGSRGSRAEDGRRNVGEFKADCEEAGFHHGPLKPWPALRDGSAPRRFGHDTWCSVIAGW